LTGARFVEIGFSDSSSVDDLKTYITEKTAAVLYVAKFEPSACSIPLDKVIKVAHNVKIPVIVDAADELPPVSNIHKYTDMGANLVIYSGGKGLMGPQGSGLILGDKDLIKACSVNASPNYGIGRPMKVDKEEIAGLTKAIELYVNKDFESEMQTWERLREYIIKKLSGVPQINCIAHKPVPPGAPGSFYLPAVYIDLNEEKLSLTKDEVVQKLWEGNPRIAVDESPTGIIIRMMMLENGQGKMVAERLLEIFK
jgi:L-seryl-tRNA(Ser) seleniumtransferase